MHNIGGDYYNIVPISDTQTAICIADVAGKGLPGALLMSNLQASLKPLIQEDIQPHDLCSRLNRTLCEIMPENKFISLFYGVLDSRNHWLTYCNAGHNAPILLGVDGSATELNSSGAILGRFPDWQYSQMDQKLSQGDTLLLFTDGVVEACDQQNELFGEQKLAQTAQSFAHQPADELLNSLLQAASDHCGGKFQDDATLIVLKSRNSF